MLLLLCINCGKTTVERNPYLPDVRLNYQINLNLPQYDPLRYAGGSLFIEGVGLNGVLVFNINGNQYVAWEASCANHPLETCSKLEIQGVLAQCTCEGHQYSLATGQLLNPPENVSSPYALVYYQILKNNSILTLTN